MTRWLVGVLGFACGLGLGVGEAYGAEPPDLVRLKNGGMLRGTIGEYVPGDHVTITLATGEQRRIEGAEVEYAGPSLPPAASAAPSPAPAPPRADEPAGVRGGNGEPFAVLAGTPTRMRFRQEGDDGENVMFHIRTATQTGTFYGGGAWGGRGGTFGGALIADSYSPICAAPCIADVPAGKHKLALSIAGGAPVAVDGLVDVGTSSTLTGRYKSYAGLRAAGWATVVGGAVLMVAAPFVTKNDCEYADDGCEAYDKGLLIGLVAGGGVATIAGLLMALKGDEASVSLSPGVAGAKAPRSIVSHEAVRGTPLGLTGALRF